jgi:DNA mismatch repair protein MutL
LSGEAFLKDLAELFESDELRAGQVQSNTALAAVRHLPGLKNLTMEEMKELVRKLSLCENPFRDLSGRPVFIVLDEKELEKEFRR